MTALLRVQLPQTFSGQGRGLHNPWPSLHRPLSLRLHLLPPLALQQSQGCSGIISYSATSGWLNGRSGSQRRPQAQSQRCRSLFATCTPLESNHAEDPPPSRRLNLHHTHLLIPGVRGPAPRPEVRVAPPHKSGSHRRPSPPRGCGSQTTRPQPRKSADPGLPCGVRRSAFSVGDWPWSPSGWAVGVAGPALGSAGSGRGPWSSVKQPSASITEQRRA